MMDTAPVLRKRQHWTTEKSTTENRTAEIEKENETSNIGYANN